LPNNPFVPLVDANVKMFELRNESDGIVAEFVHCVPV
jgi:hypothetical protein